MINLFAATIAVLLTPTLIAKTEQPDPHKCQHATRSHDDSKNTNLGNDEIDRGANTSTHQQGFDEGSRSRTTNTSPDSGGTNSGAGNPDIF